MVRQYLLILLELGHINSKACINCSSFGDENFSNKLQAPKKTNLEIPSNNPKT